MTHVFSRSRVAWAGVMLAIVLLGTQGPFADDAPGAVYAMTNAAAGNSVLIFDRAANGALTPASSVATGGKGQGAGLGSQGALTLSADQRWLLAVNAGSNDVTVFSVTDDGLQWRSKTPSRGTTPISVAIHGRLVYVLNAGTPNVAYQHQEPPHSGQFGNSPTTRLRDCELTNGGNFCGPQGSLWSRN